MKIVLIPKHLFIVLDTVVSGSGLCQGQVCFQKKKRWLFHATCMCQLYNFKQIDIT